MVWGYAPKRVTDCCATKIKNITPAVYSEFVLKVGDAGKISV